MKLILSLFIFSLAFINAKAADGDFGTLIKFTDELRTKNYDQARQYISSDSNELFDRYVKYDLGAQTPNNIVFLREDINGQFHYLRVTNNKTVNGKLQATKVALVSENGMDKIDLPETLRLDFGPNWQQRVNMIEQSYNFARLNLGDQQAAQLINTMLMKK